MYGGIIQVHVYSNLQGSIINNVVIIISVKEKIRLYVLYMYKYKQPLDNNIDNK